MMAEECKQNMFFLLILNLQLAERILCRHPFSESKRAYVVPQHVEELLKCYWSGSSGADIILITFFCWSSS